MTKAYSGKMHVQAGGFISQMVNESIARQVENVYYSILQR
jgi:hypothetical protein